MYAKCNSWPAHTLYSTMYIELQRGSADTERLADVAKTGSTCYHFLQCFVSRIYEAFLQRPMSPVQWHLSNAKDESHALCTHTSYTFAGDQPGHKFTVGGRTEINLYNRGVTLWLGQCESLQLHCPIRIKLFASFIIMTQYRYACTSVSPFHPVQSNATVSQQSFWTKTIVIQLKATHTRTIHI